MWSNYELLMCGVKEGEASRFRVCVSNVSRGRGNLSAKTGTKSRGRLGGGWSRLMCFETEISVAIQEKES